MACNCNNIYPDCDMNRWEVCQSIDILTNYYTKSEIDEKLDDIVISGGGVTVDEVQEIVDENLDDYYTKEEIDSGFTTVNNELDNKLDISAYTPTDLSQYWTSAETQNAINAATSGIPSSATIEGLRNDVNTLSGDVSNLYETKLDASAYTPTDLSEYWTSAQTKNYVDNAISDIPSGGVLAVVWEDVAFNMNDELWDSLVDAFNNDKPIYCIFHYSGDSQTYVSQIPMAGDVFISETESTMNLWRSESDTDTYFVEIKRNGSNDYTVNDGNIQWQQYLSAGSGISIHNNVVSVNPDLSLNSGSTNAVANSAITAALDAKADVTNVYNKTEVNNLINNKIICLTQNEYDSLVVKQSDTLYLIYEV